MKAKSIFICITFILISSSTTFSQRPNQEVNVAPNAPKDKPVNGKDGEVPAWTHQPTPGVFAEGDKSFDSAGLSFRYPADWELTDKSDSQQQYLALTRHDATLVVAVIAGRGQVSAFEQFVVAKRKVSEPFIRSLASLFGTNGRTAQPEAVCLGLGPHLKVEGVELKGLYRAQQSTAGVYSFVKGGRFMSLVYIRADKDGALGDVGWGMVRESLRVKDSNGLVDASLAITDLIDSGLLKPVRFPVPDYPTTAMGTKPSGSVVVRVLISESGAVTSAEVISGHPILRLSALQAARGLKFTPPLLCGEPNKVTGNIVYRFTGPRMEN